MLYLLPLLPRVLEVILEIVRLGKVGIDSLRRLHEQVVELSPGPLQQVYDSDTAYYHQD